MAEPSRSQLEALAYSLESCLLQVRALLEADAPAPDLEELKSRTEKCKHGSVEAAGVSGDSQRQYCKACLSFVWPDGRVESAVDVAGVDDGDGSLD